MSRGTQLESAEVRDLVDRLVAAAVAMNTTPDDVLESALAVLTRSGGLVDCDQWRAAVWVELFRRRVELPWLITRPPAGMIGRDAERRIDELGL